MAKNSSRAGRGQNKRNRKTKGDEFLVVGVGASAGGIRAVEQLLEKLPDDTQMSFVVIVHLSPEHESNLDQLLQRKTALPVEVVLGPAKVEPNRVYVIPAGKHLVIDDGYIKPSEPEHHRGMRVPIDLFFRSLAESYNTRAVGIVLSGTGTDGTLGLRRIKEQGGVSIAQDPHQAEYDGMPRSAINAGLVDFVLPIGEMPQKLIDLREVSRRIQVWPEGEHLPEGKEEEALRDVLSFLRARTGHDFTDYKRSTVLRRIARRLQVNHLESLVAYLDFLRKHSGETEELLGDLLITVTHFFRDHDAFATLQTQVIPRLFQHKKEGDQVRVWIAGCATGEEAYSMAILLIECADDLNCEAELQIFATDIDAQAVSAAREGLFPESIEADLSMGRLKRFFTKQEHHYHIKKEVRERVLFAQHNLLRDPPFSNLDLVSCRNLLIYLTREAQDQVLELLHFALRPEGFLFLGSSESVENRSDLFVPVSKKQRIFRRRAVEGVRPFFPANPAGQKSPPRMSDSSQWELDRRSVTYRELHQALLEKYAPPSLIVNTDYDIIHLSDNAGRFLRFAGGEPSRNLLKVVHPGLLVELRTALFEAGQKYETSRVRTMPVALDGEKLPVDIIVQPVHRPDSSQGFLLIMFDQVALPAESAKPTADEPRLKEAMVRQLDEELQRTKSQLRLTIEQYETSTEELKASNEELQAINEELRSTTEELETSKEELQSLNEELTTVNYELKDRVDEISRAHSDLENLMASTDIGTIFVDRELRIKLFTPPVQDLFNIIQSDIDRPFAHLTHRLEYNDLPKDTENTLQSLKSVEREIQTTEGRWYISRLKPYRTMEDKIDGVVLTFLDITERKRSEEEREKLLAQLHQGRERLELILKQMPAGVMIAEAPTGKLVMGNEQVERIWRQRFVATQDLEQYCAYYRGFRPGGSEYRPEERPLARSINLGEVVTYEEMEFLRGDGTRGTLSVSAGPIRDGDGKIIAGVVTFFDISERKQAEIDLRRARDELEQRVKERTQDLSDQITVRQAAERQIKELLRLVVDMQEIERGRISRDLHDHFGQQLTALRLSLETLKDHRTHQKRFGDQVERIDSIARTIEKDMDFLAWELRPAALDELGLVEALETFVKEWSKQFRIPGQFHTAGLSEVRLAPEVAISFYRIAQEALNNVAKHADAKQTDVILERRDSEVALIIEDDGRGFQPDEATTAGGMGLISMRERAALISGTLEIESQPGDGTTIFARAPIDHAHKDQR